MELNDIANKLAEHCRNNTEAQGLSELYADSAVSVEAMPMPGTDSQITEGLEGIRGKHAWWDGNMEMISGEVGGPYPHAPDKFALTFKGMAKVKATGEDFPMDEIAIYTVKGGKIVKEEFFYSM
ncbi:MAG: nuclear transport factor 2 family protein [Pseudomonadota bacterium]